LWIPSAHSPVENTGWLKCSGIRISYLDSPRGIALFHGKDGAVGLTIALDRTDNSLVNFYRYGVNATHPFKLYKSECLYSRGEHFEYSDWLLRTVTDEFSECEYTLEQLFSML
ncbi:hypothetical protein, partial [Klebsiella pneumoniae]|uniref:hypothetical protein n=1 Tax=Klebsiella pneumoniae TaxID=573 RepID=UPI001D0E24A9